VRLWARHPEKLPIIWQEPLNLARPRLISDLEGSGIPHMSRRPGQHAKTTSGYDARHAKPGGPGPAALIGTAAKAGTASLVAGAAGSALALSGTASAASAATAPSAIPAGLVNAKLVNAGLVNAALVNSGAADLAALKAARRHVVVHRAHHHRAAQPEAAHSTYIVRSGDSLSRISARFCGTAADFPSLAAASGIANPNLIFPGQSISLNCHAPVPAPAPAPTARPAHAHPAHDHTRPARHARHDGHSDGHTRPAGRHKAPGRHARTGHAANPSHVGTQGMAAFEACVISRESGGNPRAVNSSSGAGGLFQFLPSTWAGLGYASAYPGGAQTAPVSVQEAAFAKLFAEAGTSPWAPYDGC
jgi:resuscitation-promoting factor RpfC